MSNSVSRQPLRITSGWTVTLHELLELDPETLDPTDERWKLFEESLLQLHDQNRNLVIDVGWYQESEPSGSFHLRLIRDRNWGQPVAEWRGRSLPALVAQLEELILRPQRKLR